jgi:Co/Zn/Cd efflux system component
MRGCFAVRCGRCGRCGTSNMRALWATFLLNTSFTTAQALGAAAANSLALFSDTGTMAIDSATYLINITAEYYKARLGVAGSAYVEIGASLLSVGGLLAVTGAIMADAVRRLENGNDGSGQVDPIIMLIFTSLNLLVDFAMCGSIMLRRSGGVGACLLARCPPCADCNDSGSSGADDGGIDVVVCPDHCCGHARAVSVPAPTSILRGGLGPDARAPVSSTSTAGSNADLLAAPPGPGAGGSCNCASDGKRRVPSAARLLRRCCASSLPLDAEHQLISVPNSRTESCRQDDRVQRSPLLVGSSSAPEYPDGTGARSLMSTQVISTIRVNIGPGRGSTPRRLFHTSLRRSARHRALSTSEEADPGHPPPETREGFKEEVRGLGTAHELNLCSAFAHVVADTMRTLTVMACALLVAVGGFDPSRTDAIGSLVVCGVILLVAAYVAIEAGTQMRSLLCESHPITNSAASFGGEDVLADVDAGQQTNGARSLR